MESLDKCPLFWRIEKAEQKAVLSCLKARQRGYIKGAYILASGEITKQFGIVLSGRISIIEVDFWGNRNILARVGTGGMFAEAFACTGNHKLTVSVEADESCEVLFLDAGQMLTPCEKGCSFHGQLIRNMIGILAQKNQMLTQKMAHITKRSTRAKLLSFLSEQAGEAGGPCFTIPFNRQELADYLSVDRSALSSELGRLKKDGFLDFHKNQFELYASQK